MSDAKDTNFDTYRPHVEQLELQHLRFDVHRFTRCDRGVSEEQLFAEAGFLPSRAVEITRLPQP